MHFSLPDVTYPQTVLLHRSSLQRNDNTWPFCTGDRAWNGSSSKASDNWNKLKTQTFMKHRVYTKQSNPLHVKGRTCKENESYQKPYLQIH